MSEHRGCLVLIVVCTLVLASCREKDTRPAADPPVSENAETKADMRESPVDNRTLHEPKPGSGRPVAAPPVVMKPPPVPRFSRKSEVYDGHNEDYALLQSPKAAMQRFPSDPQGNVDWVSALSQGLIAPRASLWGKGVMRRRFDNIVMRETRDMPWVNFPHAQHTEWLDCTNCHPVPFRESRGSNQISMESIMRGQHCGKCHDRVAFSIFACERCHSIPHPGSPPRWW